VNELVRIAEPVEILAQAEERAHVEDLLLELAVDARVVGVPALHLVLEEEILLPEVLLAVRLREVILDLRENLLEGERLLEVILRTRVQSAQHRLVDRIRRDHDHGHVAVDVARANLIAHLEAVLFRKNDVENDEVGPAPLVGLERLFPVGRRLDFVALAPQGLAEYLYDVGIVIDEQYVPAHVPPFPQDAETPI